MKVKFLPNDSPKSGTVRAFISIVCKCEEELIRPWKKGVKEYRCSGCKQIIIIRKKKMEFQKGDYVILRNSVCGFEAGDVV